MRNGKIMLLKFKQSQIEFEMQYLAMCHLQMSFTCK